MAERGMRKCMICGKTYKYCSDCSNDERTKKETWRNIYCSENCRSIFKILSDHSFKHIDDKTAKERLDKCDLTNLNNFREDIRNQIKMIQAAVASVIKEEPRKPEFTENKQNYNKNYDHKNNHNKDIVKDNK